jgi:hypothetical protein
MSTPWIDLLFLHGHITDVRLARRLAMSKRSMPPPTVRPMAWLSLQRLRRHLRAGDGLLGRAGTRSSSLSRRPR